MQSMTYFGKRSSISRVVVAALAMVIGVAAAHAKEIASPEPEVVSGDRLAWWQDAKFGMFIHWGVYSQAGGEWKGTTNHAEWLQLTAKIPLAEYTAFARDFNPVHFDADQWVRTAKDAGMNYLVVTAKHHDGFAMYDSPSNDHNVVKGTSFGRDPLKELSEACERGGIRFCVYYSLGRDWEDPDCPTGSGEKVGFRSNLIDFPNESEKDFSKYFERKVKPQVRELLTQYGPLGIFWFDTHGVISPAQSEELIEMIRTLQPECIINSRVGRGLGDYRVDEQKVPADASREPWETCLTMNDHWGYNRADHNWKEPGKLINDLIDIVSKGGNLLLNIGPTGQGDFPEPSTTRLSQMGEWLRINDEAIYGAGPTPFGDEVGQYREPAAGKRGKRTFVPSWEWRATTRPGRLYVHLLKWPEGVIELPAFDKKVTRASLLGDTSGRELSYTQTAEGLSISLPAKAPTDFTTVIRLELASD